MPEIADRDGEVAGADVDADGSSRGGLEPDAPRGPAAASLGPSVGMADAVGGPAAVVIVVRVTDQPPLDQLRQQGGDGRPRQPGERVRSSSTSEARLSIRSRRCDPSLIAL
jgi:hypothetical protein